MSVIVATYEIRGDDRRARAEALAVEQSHELPTAFAPELALRSLAHVVSYAVGAEFDIAVVEYPEELAGGELAQLLVHLIGNVSLQDGIRLVDLEVPDSLAAAVGGGPRLGAAGIRRVLGVDDRPLLATALKPVGLEPEQLAAMAGQLAAGLDIIKDDQGLANQPWAPFRERVLRVTEAVRSANAASGRRARYLPAVAGPFEQFEERLRFAADAGADGVLLMPGVTGFDSVRYAASVLPADAIILAHPSFLGGFTASPTHGISPEVLFGPIMRLARADAVIFPSAGGRFSLTVEQCGGIAEQSRRPFAGLAASLPAPGGGMSVDRIGELVDLYGRDVLLLIGSDLHRGGDLRAAAEAFLAAASR
jgi:ribulose-bisphosphate carboxylase large chain